MAGAVIHLSIPTEHVILSEAKDLIVPKNGFFAKEAHCQVRFSTRRLGQSGDCFAALAMMGLVAVGNGLAPFRTPRDRDVTGNEGIGQAAFPTINR